MPDALPPSPFAIRLLEAEEAPSHLEALADLLLDCVQGGASVSFLWPLPRERALAFWQGVIDSVGRGERRLLVAQDAAGALLGTAQLVTDMPPNQPHRGEVSKMLVHRRARRRGVAQQLLGAVEDAARQAGRTLLVLDTATGGDAERLYARAGWQPAGGIPDFSLLPDGTPCGTSFFYKRV